MILRSFATVGLIALSVGLFGGCGGNNLVRPWDIGNRPQIVLPGAVRSDVKGLAMGSARSKGWTIVSSSDDQIVVERPVDPASPTAVALGAADSAIPPVVQVTTAFVERSDGVLVAVGADVVMQPPGEKEPQRVDYTETYRDALTQSLDSLRANWSANRTRVSNSVPSEESHAAAVAATEANAKADDPLVRAWRDTTDEAQTGTESATGLTGVGSAETATPAPETPAEPVQTTRPAPAPSAPAYAEAPRDTSATSLPPRPAPVVDGTSAVTDARPASPAPAQSALLPPVPVESVSPSENMLALNQSGTGTWAYYAEQYARLRGCELTDQGSMLIETRTDGEIHKVPCAGADSYLLKCQNGVCRGLE